MLQVNAILAREKKRMSQRFSCLKMISKDRGMWHSLQQCLELFKMHFLKSYERKFLLCLLEILTG